MKILLITQVLPYPPDSGPKVKTWNVLKYLTQNHSVTLVSFVRGDRSAAIRHLEKFCEAVHTVPIERGFFHDVCALFLSYLLREPFLMVRDDRRNMRRLVDRLSQRTQFDIVHADQLNMGQYALRVSGGIKVLDTHNALWLLYKRMWETMNNGLKKWLLGRDWRLLKRYEGEMCQSFNVVLSVSEEDKTALEEAIGESHDIKVIPIAVDLKELPLAKRAENAKHILHVGTMYWPPNVDGILWFLREVWPLLQDRRPDIQFDIVGSKPPKEITRFSLAEHSVNVTGFVEDPEPYLRSAAVMVVPLLSGGGMRVKILNALAQKIPIVSTPIGCEGIDVEDGKNIMIAESPIAFADAVIHLLKDPAFGKMLADNGYDLIKNKYDYRRIQRDLECLYAQIPSNGGKRHNE